MELRNVAHDPTWSAPSRSTIGDAVRDFELEVRAGVHTGEVERIAGKVGGIAVSVGARIAGLAAPSEVLVSQTVRDLVLGSGITFEDAGEHELKGVSTAGISTGWLADGRRELGVSPLCHDV